MGVPIPGCMSKSPRELLKCIGLGRESSLQGTWIRISWERDWKIHRVIPGYSYSISLALVYGVEFEISALYHLSVSCHSHHSHLKSSPLHGRASYSLQTPLIWHGLESLQHSFPYSDYNCIYFYIKTCHQELNIIVIWECRAQQNYPLLSSEHGNLINTGSGHIKTF